MEFGLDILPKELADLIDLTDFYPIKFYYKLSTDAKISYYAMLLPVNLFLMSYRMNDCCLTALEPAIYNY